MSRRRFDSGSALFADPSAPNPRALSTSKVNLPERLFVRLPSSSYSHTLPFREYVDLGQSGNSLE